MRLRQLTALAAGAALLGLAAAGLVRARFSVSPGAEARAPEAPRADPAEATGAAAEHEGSPAVERAETISESSPPPATAKRRRARKAPPRKQARDAFAQELERGIRKLGERRYEIDRATLELALANLGSLAGSVRVGPALRDGKPFGFRLHAVKADGPIAKLGLRDDDVLVSVNGFDLATPDRVLDAYGKLRSARHLVLGVARGERAIEQEYVIR
jgi:hypothetical protein